MGRYSESFFLKKKRFSLDTLSHLFGANFTGSTSLTPLYFSKQVHNPSVNALMESYETV